MTADELRALGRRVIAGMQYIKETHPNIPDDVFLKWWAMSNHFDRGLMALPEGEQREEIRQWMVEAVDSILRD